MPLRRHTECTSTLNSSSPSAAGNRYHRPHPTRLILFRGLPHVARVSWFIAVTGFTLGLLIVLFSSSHRRSPPQPKAPAITPAPQAPTLNTPANLGAKPGEEVEFTLTGTNLTDPTAVLLSCPAKVTIPTDNKNGTDAGKLRVKVALDPKCTIGLYTIRVATKQGVSNAWPFVVDSLALVPSTAMNRTKDAASGQLAVRRQR